MLSKKSITLPFEGRILIVIDDNNTLSSMRYQYYQIARKYSLGFSTLHFNAEISTALRLNEQRTDDKVPESVITNMFNNLEPPNPLKNNWEKFSFTVQVQVSGVM